MIYGPPGGPFRDTQADDREQLRIEVLGLQREVLKQRDRAATWRQAAYMGMLLVLALGVVTYSAIDVLT